MTWLELGTIGLPVHSHSTNNHDQEIEHQSPPNIIFDRAPAYLKHGFDWLHANQIIVLDRTEKQFPDAVDLVNQNYARRIGEVKKIPFLVPNGIELMVYQERCPWT